MIIIQELLLNILYWMIFGLIHSILATETIKSTIPLKDLPYRLFYNLVSVITLGIVLYLSPSIVSLYRRLPDSGLPSLVIVIILNGLGFVILIWGLQNWDLSGFIGMKKENDQLNTDGAYKFSRHPVYSGILLILASLLVIEISTVSLTWLLGVGGYFVLGAIPEEHKLEGYFGQEYRDYKSEIPRFFPHRISHLKTLIQAILR